MERRKFLGFGIVAAAAALVPGTLSAEDYRKTKPDVWTSHTVDDAIAKLYGSSKTIEQGVTLTAPDVAANGGAVPVDFSSEIAAKSVAVFQDANPEAAVCAFTLNENSIIDFSIKIKMKQSGTLTVVVEGRDGKLYSAKKTLSVALGGCEG
ncbi:MAG TPA: thiosulfate oxidation carrier protein SoxY [Sulfuricurvum sp.]|nr:thiosulfate oxidation carrier protein SoxY [Sulfuricurvum sp.]HQT37643.1 thiosulfate oxidation carrier protein SoxY [Sulfuricurvum sp.]